MKIRIQDYQLYLFDMDGLLVDTEALHFQAYQKFLKNRGYDLNWNLEQYLQIAHSSSSALKEAIYRLFPALLEQEVDWSLLYEEKKKAFMEILTESNVVFMPGAEQILKQLIAAQRSICIVTNSMKAHVSLIKGKLPLLAEIEGWVTREDYEKAKPDPHCYKIAIDRWSYPGFRMIGFEDSARGLISLLGTSSQSILISPYTYSQLEAYSGRYIQEPSFFNVELINN